MCVLEGRSRVCVCAEVPLTWGSGPDRGRLLIPEDVLCGHWPLLHKASDAELDPPSQEDHFLPEKVITCVKWS